MTDALRAYSAGDLGWYNGFSADELSNKILAATFLAASYLTEPICKVHELDWQLQVEDVLPPATSKMANLARKFFLILGIVGYAVLAMFTAAPAVALRYLASNLQSKPYLYAKGESPAKKLSDHTFSLLSWNICCPAGGYSISDGGVVPWGYRIDDIINKICEKDADVNCLYETFDTRSAFYICEKLRGRGYTHFYYNIGPKTIGVSSGIFVASKYDIANPEFTPFPLDSLVGRTKFAAKGVFAFDLQSEGNSFARVFSTHLQHSEECTHPTNEEVEARKKQMEILIAKTEQVKDKCLVVTGDLNLDDDEYNASTWQYHFKKGDTYLDPQRTWGGDEFCARLVKKRPSPPLNLDHTMVVAGTAYDISTSLVETGYDRATYKQEALSDHAGLYSTITV